ncbi:YesL family protein [Aquibacillus saliphilus]|uniref:YesL family protein n=1 Tax=Aquibacillus saliphilus TaxID=1909422 RepID=UPI001CF08882|nr:YesL family protein [Aquibacillus saliphilus]
MGIEGLTGQILKISNAITKMAYINFLWVLFTLLGLGVFGIMPATVSLFTILQKWVKGDKEIPIFKTFWRTFRKELFKSTILGAILVVIGYVLYFDITHLPSGGIYTFLKVGLIVFVILYLMVVLYFFPLYVHYNMKKLQYIKYSLLISVAYPQITLIMIVSAGMALYLIYTFPASILFFGISFPAYIIMLLAYQLFKKIDAKIGEKVQEVAEAK